MHRSIPILLLVGGCIEPEVALEQTQSASSKCPEPENCTVSNGGGIYAEEHGFVGIGPNEFMITHFTNLSTGSVNVRGRYHDPASNSWVMGSGTVMSANYRSQQGLLVVSVSESFTVPTWTLTDGVTTTQVTGSNILDLELLVHLNDSSGIERYTLDFTSYEVETLKATIRMANLQWRPTAGTSWQPYCRRADGTTEDPVVFQQGIGVDPINAAVVRNSAFVTLACRRGAPPTVRLWGYPYRPGGISTDYFDAGLHMKRASYCGDDSYYTKANTDIVIYDDKGIQSGFPSTQDPADIEASWGTTRAICVNRYHRRHPWIQYDGVAFDGTCADGTQIPECSSLGSLADMPSP